MKTQLTIFFIAAGLIVNFPDRTIQQNNFLFQNLNLTQMIRDTPVHPKVMLEQTNFADMIILFVSDTASTTDSIKDVLEKGYGELMQFISANKLQPKKFIAWYYAMRPPWPLDVAVETDRKPEMTTGRIQTRIQPGGEVIIAHMWGPYDQVSEAYVQIEKWLKKSNRSAKGSPFEVYINSPDMVKDPSELQTDVYQPLQ